MCLSFSRCFLNKILKKTKKSEVKKNTIKARTDCQQLGHSSERVCRENKKTVRRKYTQEFLLAFDVVVVVVTTSRLFLREGKESSASTFLSCLGLVHVFFEWHKSYHPATWKSHGSLVPNVQGILRCFKGTFLNGLEYGGSVHSLTKRKI